MARHSLVWRWRTTPVAREKEQAAQLDLLANSSLLLSRAAIASTTPIGRTLAPHVANLAEVFADLGADPGNQQTRQRAVDRTLAVARDLVLDLATRDEGDSQDEPDPTAFITPVILVRIVAMDLLVFAGVKPAEASAAMHDPTGHPPPIDEPPMHKSDNRTSRS